MALDKVTRTAQVQEIIRCGKDPTYFIKKYVKIQHPKHGTIPFETYPFQDDCLEAFIKHRLNIVLKSRQLGLSTLAAAYAAWLAIFYKDKNILIIATKLPTAMNFIKKVKVILQNIPQWLLLPKFEPTKQSITFDNGSQIVAIPTSDDAGRSEALSLLIVDECVAGETQVEVRDKLTGEELKLSVKQLYDVLCSSSDDVSYIFLEDNNDTERDV